MDGLGELIGGIADIAATATVIPSGNGKNADSGCAAFLGIMAIIGLLALPFACLSKKPEKPVPAPLAKEQPIVKRETIPHLLGRKTKDSVIEFGKGVIGK